MTSNRSRFLLALLLLLVAAAVVMVVWWRGSRHVMQRLKDSGAAPPTFARDVAPIVYEHCSMCHRPGEAAPFDLLSYGDVQRHVKQIAGVLDRGLMPPWMPEGEHGVFLGDRRLAPEQVALIQRWIAEGAPEGNASEAPSAPVFAEEWKIGTPDLILESKGDYTLPADGKDVYRNFVLPTTLPANRYVRAVEMHPGNKSVVHHVFLMLDQTTTARRRDSMDGQSGYAGMSPGDDVAGPSGQLLGWQPGRGPCVAPEGSPWRLPPGADIVLVMHLRPSGKPQPIRPSVGLYFTDAPPSRPLFNLLLRSTAIDIPAGAKDYTIQAEYTLPVDAELLAVLPHAHYLGKDLKGYAVLPTRTEMPLIHIPAWDFDWQTDYRYATPKPLARGTVLHMRYTYENSADNPRNQHSPPQRTTFGPNSSDEMGELWLQLRLKSAQDAAALTVDYITRFCLPESIERIKNTLAFNPGDAASQADLRAQLAAVYIKQGRIGDATPQLDAALKLNPASAPARRCIGSLLFDQGKHDAAVEQFRKAIAADPNDYRSRADLGLSLAILGKLPEAVEQMQAAIQLNPNDALTHTNLARVLAMQGNPGALAEIDLAMKLNPEDAFVRQIHGELHTKP